MSKRMIGLALLLTALCMSVTVQAGNARAARKQVESSLLVSGTITIAPDGSVQAHTLDSTDELGDALSKFVDSSIVKWRFEPVVVDGNVVSAKVPMSLRLVAKSHSDGNLSVTIAGTHFGTGEDARASDGLQAGKLSPPHYPTSALRKGGKGVVYLVVQVGRDGSVINVDSEQVNLRVVGTDGEMALLRRQFADAALRAAKGWKFIPPTTGEAVAKESWLARVPVDFELGDRGDHHAPGKWKTYVPGPRNMDMPWAREEISTAGSPDALSEGGVYSLRQGATLLPSPAS